MADSFPNHAARIDGPITNAEVANISSTDAVPSLGAFARGFIVGVAGDVKVDFWNGATGVVLPQMAAGVEHGAIITKIYKTGTTATSLVLVY